MKETITQVTKVTVRALMAVGALLGFTSCPRPQECVYGPPPGIDTLGRVVIQDSIEVIEDVYGPPVEMAPDSIVDEQVTEPETEQ